MTGLRRGQKFIQQVTQRHIDMGVPGSPALCALGQKIRDPKGLHARSVQVGIPWVLFTLDTDRGPRRYRCVAEGEAFEFERAFDCGEKPKPFTVVLTVVASWVPRKLGPRAAAGRAPKSKHRKVEVPGQKLCVRRYHQLVR